jgi:hypothetical protein
VVQEESLMPGGGRGIEWMIDLDAKTHGATDVIQALGKTKSAADVAGAAIDRAMRSMDKLPKSMGDSGWSKGLGNLTALTKGAQLTDREFGAVKARAAMVTSELDNIGKAKDRDITPLWKEVFQGTLAFEALKMSGKIVLEVFEKIGQAAERIVKAAAGQERLEHVFANMLGKDEGAETLAYLDKFADYSEFTDDAVKSMGNELLRAGLRGADFRNALAAVVDVAAQAPDKMEGAQEAVASLSRINLMGRVDARTLRGLRINPHEVADQLSKDLGLSKEVIKKQLQEGTLDGAKAMDSIFTVMERKSGKQLGAVGDNMADTLSSRLDKLEDIPHDLFKGLSNAQGFRDISDTMARITNLFGPGSETGNRLQSALVKTLDLVGEKIKEIDWDEVADSIGRIAESTQDWIEPLSTLADVLGLVLKAVAGLMALPTLGKDIGDWMARKLNPEINQNSAAKQESIDRIENENERFWVKSGLRTTGGRLAGSLSEGFTDKAEINSPSRLFARHGEDITEGLALGIESGGGVARAAVAGLVSPPSIGDMSGAAGAMGGAYNFGGFTVAPTIVVQGSSASPDQIKQAVEQGTQAALLSALEQFNVSAGLA